MGYIQNDPNPKVDEQDGADEEQFDMLACCNRGHPIVVEWDGKTRDFIAGFGLCSPARWTPSARGVRRTAQMRQLAEATFGILRDAVVDAFGDVRGAAQVA